MVQEIIKCPSCSARYRLRPERVHSGLMRARCFRCGTDFPVAEAIMRLLNAKIEIPCQINDQTEESRVTCALEEGAIVRELDGLPSFVEPMTTDESASASSDAEPPPSQEASEPNVEIDTTTLAEPPSTPELVVEPKETAEDEQPAPVSNDAEPPPSQEASEPNVEIDTTTLAEPPSTPELVAESEIVKDEQPALASSDAEPPPSQEASEPNVEIDTTTLVEPPSTPELVAEPKGTLKNEPEPAANSTVIPPPQEASKPNVGIEPAIPLEPPKQEVAEFKIRTSETLIEHLKIEEVAAMAEDGRLKEYHLVARQSSENWIEAPKVPALRPIYDKRRSLLNPDEPPSLSVLDIPHKRGLFSRLFGRK